MQKNQHNLGWGGDHYIWTVQLEDSNSQITLRSFAKMESNNGIDPILTENQSHANAGSWSFHQNLSYAIFIDIHKKQMTSKKKMRAMDFFQKLSIFIKTRTPAQCRSHHQKVFGKFKFVSKITEVFKTQLGKPNYRQLFAQGMQSCKRIDFHFVQSSSQLNQNSQIFQQNPIPSQLNQEYMPNSIPPQNSLNINEEIQLGPDGGVLWLNFGEGIVPYMLANQLL